MVVLHEEVEMVKNGEHGCGHGPKGSHRNIPSLTHLYRPSHIRVSYNGGDWEFKPIKELLKWSFHLGENSCNESREVVSSIKFRWDYVGDRPKSDVDGLVVGRDETQPLFGDNK
ncbi:hypothetical protein J1N35_031691 [Gossypium stocksii]|uniref:Uncharacterized protein n=1 Tax=Gossypium stocksii TaxID=47602 RepID=A0A9D3V319_9ROSI|nr:hypothetical protein J1N35_031691 [Gossypium stocksii]